MLQCPKCSFDNELGRIFCHSCGTKLDLSQIKPPTEGAKLRRRMKKGVVRTVRIVVELAIVVVLVTVITLICLTPEVKPFQATSAELMASDTKRNDLDKLVLSRKGGQLVVTEGELNAYLNSLSFDKPTGNGIEVIPVAMRATLLKDGAVMLQFLGSVHFSTVFDKRLYLAYECTPVIRDGKCQFQPNGGWLGKLPLHPKLLEATGFVDNYFARLFNNLAEEKKQLLDKLSKITITKDAVTFEKEPAR